MLSFFKNKKSYSIGNTLKFGTYPQKNENDNTPIEWIILDIYNDIALLITKYSIITSEYCDIKKSQENNKYIEWKNSLARKVCNETFYDIAFNYEEKQIICAKKIKHINHDNSCNDNVFLLSENEVIKYFPSITDRLSCPTKYAKSKGARVGWCGYENYTPWWILPHYESSILQLGNEYYPKAVFHNGKIQYHSRNIFHSDFTIRPCIQIDLNKYKKFRRK